MCDGFTMSRDHIRRQYGAIDVLPAAEKFDIVTVHMLSSDGKPVQSACGQKVEAHGPLGSERYDIVVLCDFAWDPIHGLPLMALLSPWLMYQASLGATVASCGSAAALLAHSGLANGQHLSAPNGLALDFAHEAILDCERDLIIEGQFISSCGGVADFTAALHLVERVTSRNVSRWLATQWGMAGSGADLHDPLMVRAEAYLQAHFSRPISITALAVELNVDRRTLHRHCVAATGRGPMEYLHGIRMEAAKNMLIRTPFTMDRIAGLVGYSDTAHFRAIFRKTTGRSPREWRRAMRQSQM
jgi:transcriptional regulator GlxA family with amidase domain